MTLLFLAACAPEPRAATARPAVRADASAVAAASAAPAPLAQSATTVATAAPVVDPARARSLVAERDRCLQDPACSRGETARLTIEAADAGATDDCALFYYGTVVPVDWHRARQCYERESLAAPPCGGNSPSLDRIQLAIMMLDGQGGTKLPFDAVRPVLRDCFDDASIQALQAPMPKEPVDFCTDIGGTTLSMNDCAAGGLARAELERFLVRKDIAARVGKDALAKEEEAAARFARFANAASDLGSDNWRGGSGRNFVYASEEETLIEARTRSLAAFAQPIAFPSARDRADAERDHASLAKTVQDGADGERKKLLADAETEFRGWRSAEIAFERAAVPPADGARAETDAIVRATRIWNDSLGRLTSEH